jgi:type VII secretion-associated protein (TIGR03931 family)
LVGAGTGRRAPVERPRPVRVAVQGGALWLRVAAEGRLLAELPVAETAAVDVLTGLFDTPVDELVVVQPAGAGPQAVPTTAARRVRTVPAAVGALVEHAASTHRASGYARDPVSPDAALHAVVVDIGHGGTEVVHVRAGRVCAVRRVAVGGARLDAVTADLLARTGVAVDAAQARHAREALSLLPTVRAGTPPAVLRGDELGAALAGPLAAVVAAVIDVVRAAADADAGRAPPVLLVGGVARMPLLAELLDAAGVDDVSVAGRPDTAAVLGALRAPVGSVLPGSAVPPDGRVGPAPEETRRISTRPAVGLTSVAAPTSTWLPPVVPARRRASGVVLATLAALAGVIGLLAAGSALPAEHPAVNPAANAAPAAPATADGLVQYGYAVRLPAGWAHTGGLPERRRSLLTPAMAPNGSDLISVERTPLGYDTDAEPQRARAELRARFAAAVGEGAPLSAFDAGARFAGRPVVSYREAGTATTGDVDWFVVLDGDAQLSVGCRYTPTRREAVVAACATVVGSMHRTA